MSPRLVDHLQHSLNSRQLMDPSMRRAPEQLNPWAVFCAWCVDWFVAYAFAAIAVNAWMSFVGPLGLDRLPTDARFMVSAYGERMSLILAPVIFFSMSFLGILFNNMTPGLRLFKHRVEHSTVKSSLLWSWASTLSPRQKHARSITTPGHSPEGPTKKCRHLIWWTRPWKMQLLWKISRSLPNF